MGTHRPPVHVSLGKHVLAQEPLLPPVHIWHGPQAVVGWVQSPLPLHAAPPVYSDDPDAQPVIAVHIPPGPGVVSLLPAATLTLQAPVAPQLVQVGHEA